MPNDGPLRMRPIIDDVMNQGAVFEGGRLLEIGVYAEVIGFVSEPHLQE